MTIEKLTLLDLKRREPGCECHQEEGDSPCPVHDDAESRAEALQAEVARLTAALEAAEESLQHTFNTNASLTEAGCNALNRAEALQARVVELEAALAAARGCDPTRCLACYASPGQHYGWCKLAAAESELADLRGRVGEALELLTGVEGEMVRLTREVLRGRCR